MTTRVRAAGAALGARKHKGSARQPQRASRPYALWSSMMAPRASQQAVRSWHPVAHARRWGAARRTQMQEQARRHAPRCSGRRRSAARRRQPQGRNRQQGVAQACPLALCGSRGTRRRGVKRRRHAASPHLLSLHVCLLVLLREELREHDILFELAPLLIACPVVRVKRAAGALRQRGARGGEEVPTPPTSPWHHCSGRVLISYTPE
jgi:hypothetical protein